MKVAPAVSGLGGLGIDRGLAQPFAARLFCKRATGQQVRRLREVRQFGPIPTLGELQRTTPWVWLWCERCQHHAPLACAVAVILWGSDASSDKLRAGARCTDCGAKGATLQRPGWAGNDVGFYPFPTASDDEVGEH